MKKKPNKNSAIVYSTNPDFKPAEEPDEMEFTLAPAQQKIRIRLDTRHRAGKAVSLIENLQTTEAEKETICKKLKNLCGTGGSVKEGFILIQGDHRDKILQWFYQNGFTAAKK